jgi:hypothetical protein
LAVNDIGARVQDRRAGDGDARFLGLGRGERAHACADRAEGQKETQAHQQQAAFGAHAHTVALCLVAQAQVLAFDGVGVLALLARLDDPRERAEGRAGHGVTSRDEAFSNRSSST